MNVGALVDVWERAGIRLSREGDDLIAEIQLGACLDPYREQIVAHKPTLLAMLDLQQQIVAAATVEPAVFDRAAYDALWGCWYALAAQETMP